jgi:hypothetical protein
MNNKPQQPKFDPSRIGLPKDIRQVIERLKARGVIGMRFDALPAKEWHFKKSPRTECKWCGQSYSETYTKHLCKTRRLALKHV